MKNDIEIWSFFNDEHFSYRLRFCRFGGNLKMVIIFKFKFLKTLKFNLILNEK